MLLCFVFKFHKKISAAGKRVKRCVVSVTKLKKMLFFHRHFALVWWSPPKIAEQHVAWFDVFM